MTSINIQQSKDQKNNTPKIKRQDNVISSPPSSSSSHFDPTTLTESLPLLPFQNQVGGHCSFFRFSKRAICKPMSHKERQFYEHLEQHHVPLLPFTSQYLGVVNVTYRSSNVQAMLPEVILADNEHLLANWKRVCSSSSSSSSSNQRPQQQQQHRRQKQKKKKKMHRRSISNDNHRHQNKYNNRKFYNEDDDINPTSTWSPTAFKEQVLREVFSPHALEERLRQVQDWQKGMRQNQLLNDRLKLKKDSFSDHHDSQKVRLQSRSVLDFRQSIDSSIPPLPSSTSAALSALSSSSINNNDSLRYMSSSYPTNEIKYSTLNNNENKMDFNDKETNNNDFIYLDDMNENENIENNENQDVSPQVTVHPRRPTIIETTTSAPQTPRMRETRLHNPIIRPPTTLPSSTSPQILPTSSSPLPESPTSTVSSSSISILPSPLPSSSQQQHEEEENPALDKEKEQVDDQIEEEEKELILSKEKKNKMIENEKKKNIDNNNKEKQESASWRPRRAPTNPWSEQMYRRDLEKVNINDVQQFILIEDLTDDIKYPCVLDLKMGTRQHGVYATKAKMISQTGKCEQSTSFKLGVRISGMQIYNFHQTQFIFEDKYKGRKLTPITFRETLIRYFDNGHGCQVDFLPTLIRKLVLIFRIIESMDSYRFYASSLLIIYDANSSFNQLKNDTLSSSSSSSSLPTTSTTTTSTKNKIDVRLIDFAKSVSKQEWFTQKHLFTYPPTDITDYHKTKDNNEDNYGPDPGYLLGVQTLIKCFLWIYTNHGGKKEILSDLNDAVSSIQSSPFWSKNDIDAL